MPSGSESSERGTATPCPSVAVVMLHWGPEEVTKRCLQSLGRIAYPTASIILIDNTHTLPPSVTGWPHPLSLDLVRPGRNLGFAEGCTVGMSIALERGEGCHVWDSEGRKYLDLYGGHAVCLTGHCHPKVVQAVQEQIGRASCRERVYVLV